MRQEMMKRALEAFGSMDIDAAERCLGIVEMAAELFPSPEAEQEVGDAVQEYYQSNKRGLAAAKTGKAPINGAISINWLTKPESRSSLN